MFALCGVMIVVGIAYIVIAPQPAPVDPTAVVAPPTELAAADLPAEKAAAVPPTTLARSLDTQANAAPVHTSVPTITPTLPVATPPTTTARPVPTPTTTVTTLGATTTTVPDSPVTKVLSITLSAAAPLIGAPPPTTIASTARVVGRTDSGVASWFNAPDATCAHRTLPFGTMVTVTRAGTSRVTQCKVDDRGPTVATGRLIDLSMDTFELLASTDAGLIDVTIEW